MGASRQYSFRVDGGEKPAGRIDAPTMSVADVVDETLSVDDTVPADVDPSSTSPSSARFHGAGRGRSACRCSSFAASSATLSALGDRLILWDEGGTERVAPTPGRPIAVRAPDGQRVIVGTETAIGFFGATDSDGFVALRPGQQTMTRVIAVGASARGLIAVGTLAGRVHVFDDAGTLITSRRAPGIRGLGFTSDGRLVADSGDATFFWSLAPETRDAVQVRRAVEALIEAASD